MSKYKLIIFDLDGTLLDTSEGILKSVKETLMHFHLDDINDEVIHRFIGPPIQVSFETYCGLKGAQLQEATNYFRALYSGENLLLAKAYEGIYEVLQYLKTKGITSAVATYKREDYAIRLLKAFHFDDYTGIMYGADNFNQLTKEDIIRTCMEAAGVTNPASILMVGDTLHDAEGAQKIGMDFIGVTYGFGFTKDENGNEAALLDADGNKVPCKALVNSPLQLIQALNAE